MRSNLHKAIKAENLLSRLSHLPLYPDSKQAIADAEYILSEVRHACQLALDVAPNSTSDAALSIMRRLFENIIAHRPDAQP